ncbi:MAG: GxxExxY protein [Planctomycetota bacterium]
MEPQMNADERRFKASLPINDLTEQVIGCAYEVSNTLGAGFLEKVYENALALELRETGFHVIQQHPVNVLYRDKVVGDYVADLFVDQRLIIEIKAVKGVDQVHIAQCINYLRATNHHVGLLLNFGKPKLEVRRLVHRLSEKD